MLTYGQHAVEMQLTGNRQPVYMVSTTVDLYAEATVVTPDDSHKSTFLFLRRVGLRHGPALSFVVQPGWEWQIVFGAYDKS